VLNEKIENLFFKDKSEEKLEQTELENFKPIEVFLKKYWKRHLTSKKVIKEQELEDSFYEKEEEEEEKI
jgi:hypothetical protein